MGIPITHTCALDGCEVLSSSATGWFFDVVDLFTPRAARRERSGEVGARRAWLLAESHRQAADAPRAAQRGTRWACCKSHKDAAIREQLKHVPAAFHSLASQAVRACEHPEQLMAEA
jgi:hypothetical protein